MDVEGNDSGLWSQNFLAGTEKEKQEGRLTGQSIFWAR
jgi:hypothetical protein